MKNLRRSSINSVLPLSWAVSIASYKVSYNIKVIYSVLAIFLGKSDGLHVLLVSSVQVGRDSSELNKFMIFSGLGKRELVNVFILSDRSSKRFIVFIFKVNLIEGFVDGLDVLVLDTLQEIGNDFNISSVLHLKISKK